MRWLISLLVAISLASPSIAQTRPGVWLLTHSKRPAATIVTTPPLQGNLIAWFDPTDTTKMNTTTTGSTNVAADGDTVGKWIDKSSNGFDIVAAGDNTSRPLWRSSGGIKWVEADGTDDILLKSSPLGFYGLSGFTVVMGIRANPAAERVLISDGRLAGFPQAFTNIIQSHDTTATTASARYNRSDNSQVIGGGTSIQTGVFNNTDKCYAVTDSTTVYTPYVDGVAGTPLSYTRSGTVSGMDTFALFGFYGYGSTFDFFATRLYVAMVYNTVLTPAQVLNACRYVAYLQGRTI